MNGAIFIETLKRNWRQMFYWGIGLGFLGFYIVSIVRDVDTLKQYQDIIGNKLPPAVMQAMGISDMAALATPEGFIALGFILYAMILLLVYAVLSGMNITANEEDDGSMDVLLTQPVARWRVVTEKYAAYGLLSGGIILVSYLGLLAGRLASPLDFSMGRLMMTSIPLTLGVWFIIAATAAANTFFRRKSTATVVIISFIVVSYFLNVIGNAASTTAAGALKDLSFFQYMNVQGVVQHGLVFTSLLILVVATAVMFGLSVVLFERRDVGV